MQALYSYTNTSSAANAPADRPAAAAALSMMPELHVEGFDAEQIWLQLDMASAQLVRRAKRLLKKAGSEPSLLTPENEEDLSGQHAAFHGVQLHPCKCYPVYRFASAGHFEHLRKSSYSSSPSAGRQLAFLAFCSFFLSGFPWSDALWYLPKLARMASEIKLRTSCTSNRDLYMTAFL